jgi:hypothetical protein
VGAILAFALPLGAHAFAGNVLEPLLFGRTLNLHPVTVLLSLLMWGAVWGVTGMVLAVPITAVLRIRLSHIQHPLPQFAAAVLVGGFSELPRDISTLPSASEHTPLSEDDAAIELHDVEDGHSHRQQGATSYTAGRGASSTGPPRTSLEDAGRRRLLQPDTPELTPAVAEDTADGRKMKI